MMGKRQVKEMLFIYRTAALLSENVKSNEMIAWISVDATLNMYQRMSRQGADTFAERKSNQAQQNMKKCA